VLEVRPPVRIDKGVGIRAFLEGADVDVALYAGDDRTDLDAFRTLAELAEEGRVRGAIRVGVHSDEGPAEITEEADVVVEGTEGVHELLAALIAD
jgi:trehalose 6-phosphate phosphatase